MKFPHRKKLTFLFFRTEDMKEFFEDILQCPNCNTQIKDPRILPCHHSFCLNCLREHIEDGLQNCAICQQKVPLPVNNVYGFPKNDILHKILNFLGSSNGKYRILFY